MEYYLQREACIKNRQNRLLKMAALHILCDEIEITEGLLNEIIKNMDVYAAIGGSYRLW